ncbi:MAG TPA: TFIIB-type zinc ribbon-containing protein [Nitrososphaerales archaeon]|nr:TFIIB-type zinc ribbon-containing protein [Nitrososphaerales archaeon]
MSIENSKNLSMLRRPQGLIRCPRCGQSSLVLDANTGEQVCTNCGYVIKEGIEDTGPEWRNFAKEQGEGDRSRTGSPSSLALHDMGLSTVIGLESTDASGNALKASMKNQLERLRTWDRRSKVHDSSDRNLRQAFSQLDRLAEKINVGGPVIEKAAYIYRKAMEKKLIRGRSISSMITASLYAALRDTETPRTLKDLASASGVKKNDLAQSYRLILKEMDLRMPVRNPAKYISRIGSKAGASERTQRRALEILRKAQETGGSAGKDPMGLAAAALYVASVMENEAKTQKDYAQAAGVTEVTIRNRYKTLKESLKS